MPLPLLHHAVYSHNLLRNPLFLAAANADYSASMQQRLARMAAAGNSSTHRPAAVMTAEQRKFAWVGAVLRAVCVDGGRGQRGTGCIAVQYTWQPTG